MSHRVLIVDDDPTLRAVLEEYLRGIGFVIRCAHDGNDALQLMAVEPFDAVFTDVRMPGMDGHALMDAINERHPGINVVMMTAFPTGESAEMARRQRVRAYFEKPLFDLESLRVAVEAAIAARPNSP